MSKDTRGQRGKTAEKITEDWLKVMNRQFAQFKFLRLPDARSARGRMKAMPSDFLIATPRGATFIEVKEVDHEFRIPAANISQLPELKAWKLAGARACVLVLFKRQWRWRCVDVGDMETRSNGSWDWSGLPDYETPEEAFRSIYEMDKL